MKEAYEEDEAALRPRLQDIGNIRALRRQTSWLRSHAKNASIPVFRPDRETNWPRIPKKGSEIMERGARYEARIAELERLLGQAPAENELFKKPLP